MVGESWERAADAVGLVKVDRRTCVARPIAGGGHGCVAGPAVLAASEADVRTALAWLPGRILVLAEDARDDVCLRLVVPSVHRATLLAVVLLGDEGVDVSALSGVNARVPVVSVDRESDQRFIRRAVRLVVDVHAESEVPVDLRHSATARPALAHRGTDATIRLGEPGTVRH